MRNRQQRRALGYQGLAIIKKASESFGPEWPSHPLEVKKQAGLMASSSSSPSSSSSSGYVTGPTNRTTYTPADLAALRRKITALSARAPIGTSDTLGAGGRGGRRETIGVVGGKDVVAHDLVGMMAVALRR